MATIYAFIWAASGAPYNAANAAAFTSLHARRFPLLLACLARSCCSLLTCCALCSLCRCRPETDREPNLQGAPTELIHLMKRCWALDPLGRPRTFQDIASALDRIEKRASARSADQGGYYAASFDNSTVTNFDVPNPIFSSNEQQEAKNDDTAEIRNGAPGESSCEE